MKYFAFVIAGGLLAVGAVVTGWQASALPIVRTEAYAQCEASPNSTCLIDLALSALPANHTFPDWHRAKPFADAGQLQFAVSRLAAGADLSPMQPATAELVELARNGPDELAAAPLPQNASMYIAALFLLQDHHAYGGGYTPIVEAEAAAFATRHPLNSSAALVALLSRWEEMLTANPDAKQLAEFGQILLLIGRIEESRALAIRASALPLHEFPADLVLLLSKVGESARAVELTRRIEHPKSRSHAQTGLARVLAEKGDVDLFAELVPLADQTIAQLSVADKIDHQLRLVESSALISPGIESHERAASLYSLAGRPSPFKPFYLLDAGRAYLAVGDRARAARIVREALRAAPPEDDVVGVGLTMGPIQYDDGIFGLKSELLDSAATVMCQAGHLQDAISIVAEANDFHRAQAADELYACTLARQEPLDVEHLAAALNLPGQFRLHLRAAAFHITQGERNEARLAIQRALAHPPKIGDAGWLALLLRLTVAMEAHDLSRPVLSQILRSAMDSERPSQMAYTLIEAAGLVRHQL